MPCLRSLALAFVGAAVAIGPPRGVALADDDPRAPRGAAPPARKESGPTDGAASGPRTESHPLDAAAALLAEIAPRVEKACGAEFPSPPQVVELSRSEAEAAFADDLRPEYERRYASAPEAARATLLRLASSSSVESSLARYSFGRRAIVVVREGFDRQRRALGVEGERATALLAVTLAHECVHALDDARFDLARVYRAAADDEAVRAVAMVVEGRAVHFGRVAAAAGGAPADLVVLLPGGDTPAGEREWHLHLTYRLGAAFVKSVTERGGTKAADELLAKPSATTWALCFPERWPDRAPDARPAAVLDRAGLSAEARTLSQLQLLERYAALRDLDDAIELLRGFAGGAQALTGSTNAAVLAFADEDAAERYAARSAAEAPTHRSGTLVARAIGADADGVLAKLVAALRDRSP